MKEETFYISIPSEIKSNALAYTIEYIFGYRLGINYDLTYQPVDEILFGHQKSDLTIKLGKANGIVKMSKMELDLDSVAEFNHELNCPKYFVDHEAGIGFDLLSAVFFLLSRYEEYVNSSRDRHGRFLAKDSIQRNWGTLQLPLIDFWLQQFRNQLALSFDFIQCKKEQFECVNTLDIDQAFAVKGKPFFKVIGRMAKDLLKLNFETFFKRAIGFFSGPDPFTIKPNKFEQMESPHVFYLMSNESSFDKNIWLHTKIFENQVKELSAKAQIGIHPSYTSNGNQKQLCIEKERLEPLAGSISKSRQHYLMLDLPSTYQALIACGINEDFTMGFSDQSGFRAGTSRPFYFFDLKKDEETKLMVTPFCMMDVSLMYYQKCNLGQATVIIDQLMNNIFSCKGMFVSLWHNESISGFDEWKGWDEVHDNMLKKQKELLNEV